MSRYHDDLHWECVVRFATEPDDPHQIASQLAPLVRWVEIGVRRRGDLEVVLHVPASSAYEAARVALDRVQAAMAETAFTRPELLQINVLALYGGNDPDDPDAPSPPR